MQKVDAEIRKIIDQQFALAKKLHSRQPRQGRSHGEALLELETIDADQIQDIMDGRPPRAPSRARRRSRVRRRMARPNPAPVS